MRVCGKNVFNELDKSKIKKVYLSKNFHDEKIIQELKKYHLKYVLTDANIMDKMMKNNQGIIFDVYDYEYGKIEDALEDNFVLIGNLNL